MILMLSVPKREVACADLGVALMLVERKGIGIVGIDGAPELRLGLQCGSGAQVSGQIITAS
jgi:hypothetical protein